VAAPAELRIAPAFRFPPSAPEVDDADGEDDDVVAPVQGSSNGAGGLPSDGPQSLAEVARMAMLKAERDLIIPTLRRVHWKPPARRPPLLGISYKNAAEQD